MNHRWSILVLLGCAWVLWRGDLWVSPSGGPKTWEIVDTFDTKQACVDEETRRVTLVRMAMPPALNPPELQGEGPLLVQIDRRTLSVTFYCLPDTLDPRPR